MTTKVDTSIEVDVPISTAYNQWTQFESFPEFMGGITEVNQLSDMRLHWVAEIAGVKREWDATIVDQVADTKVAWVATEGATNAGAVYFTSVSAGRTLVRLHLEYEPEGLVEAAGDRLNIVQKQAEGDLERFKKYIEARGAETDGWRGAVVEKDGIGTPGVEDAAQTRGDSGKAGVSGAAVAAGVVAAAAGAALAGAAMKKAGAEASDEEMTGESEPAVDPLMAEPLAADDLLSTREANVFAPLDDPFTADPLAVDPPVTDPPVADPLVEDPFPEGFRDGGVDKTDRP